MLLIRLSIIIPIFTIVFNGLNSQEIYDSNSISFVFAGDIMGHDSQINSAYIDSTRKYQYDSCFKYISPFIQNADIAVANLEVTLAGPPYKGYPQFSSPDELACAIKNAGFDILITANNHSLDRGKKGLERTIDVLDTLGIIHTGTFKDSLSRVANYPLIFEKNNIKVALFNYTYGTNGIKVSKPNIVNYIDTLQIKSDFLKADSAKTDFNLVTIHWGIEYERVENAEQRKLARSILNMGADAIIGMHPHVVQPIRKFYAIENDSIDYQLVIYSLGNYISNQRKRYTDGGIMFYMEIQKTVGTTRINDFSYLPTWIYKPKNGDKETFVIVPANSFEKGLAKEIISEETKEQMKIFYEDTKSLLIEIPENEYIYIE